MAERLTEHDIHILQQKLCDMKRRCFNPQCSSYKDYGGRGITVCEEWADKKTGHAAFQKWAVENGWEKGKSIDRIDVNGNYCPENCRWATPKEQSNNRRDNHFVEINGERKTVSEWANIVGISHNAMEGRIRAGWSENKLLQPRIEHLKMGKGERGKEIRKWRALNNKSIALMGKDLETLVNLEEQGRLIELPCKIGDTVYYINTHNRLSLFKNTVYEAKVARFVTTRYGTSIVIQIRNEYGCTELYSEDNYNKTVFLTREEAEAALKEVGK